MKKIKYYDEIKGEEVELNVTNDVAEEMRTMRNNEMKQERKIAINELSVDAFENGQAMFIDESDNPLEALIKKEDKQNRKQEKRKYLLKKGIKTLTDKERVLIKKIFYDNYSQAELARELNIARATIKNRYDSALNKLKEFILNNE